MAPTSGQSRAAICSVGSTWGKQHHFERGLAHVIAQRGGVEDVEDQELLIGARGVAQTAERAIDLHPGEANTGELAGRTRAGHDRRAAIHCLNTTIDQRTIAFSPRANQQHRRVASRWHGGPRDGHDDPGALHVGRHGFAREVHFPAAAHALVGRFARLIVR